MSRAYDGGFVVDADVLDESLARVHKLLIGVPHGVERAVGSALARAASTAESRAGKMAAKEYAITQGTFRDNVKHTNHVRVSGGLMTVEFGFRGYVLPLMEFDTKVSKTGHITTRVKRGGVKQTLDHAFAAQVGGHTGVYERKTVNRFPLRELYGPSTAHMFMSEEMMDTMTDAVTGVYELRVEHEISRILNGYGL